MKYIIEIPDKDKSKYTLSDKLSIPIQIGNNESTVSIYTGLKLTPYYESAAEQRGREEAWKLACHLYNVSPDVTDVIYRSMNGGKGLGVALEMSYAEAREKYEAWKEQKDIKVGDEVSCAGNVFIVTRINDPNTIPDTISGIGKNGETFSMKDKKKWHKTGRSFPIVDLLEKMREPE